MLKKNYFGILLACILCLAFVGLTAQNAFGSAWIGEDGGGGGGGGGGTHHDCKNYPKGWNNGDCNGAVWVYYEYVKNSHDNQSVGFAPGKRSSRIIPGDCAKSDVDHYGFWHLGFYVEFNDRNNPYTSGYLSDTTGGVYNVDYLAKKGSALTTSHGTLKLGWIDQGSTFYVANPVGLYHVIQKDGTPMYQASLYGPDWLSKNNTNSKGEAYSVADAYAATVAEYNRIHGTTMSDKPGKGLWAFCSTPDGSTGGNPAVIKGTISATIDGTSYANGATYEATSDVTTIRYTDTVFTENNKEHTVNVCYSGSDNQGGQTNYRSCYNFTPTNTTDNQYPVIALNTPENMSQVEVCHYLDHPTAIDKDGGVSGSGRETHCIKIKRTASSDSGDCGDMGISYNDYTAYTDAQMIFRFNDKTTKLGYDGEGNSKIHWAKPGDNVQYEYKMCSSSEYARTASHDEPAKGFGSSDTPKFDLSANKNGSNNSAYLFGHTPTSYTNSNMTNYYVGFTSPDKTLACNLYQGAKASKSKFYQIPAESGASCDASKVAEYSDVGSTFEQKLSYRKISTRKYSVPYTGWYSTSSCNQYGCTTHWHSYTYYQYGTELASSSSQTLTGTVKVPYNYALVPYMKHSNNDGITYAGASFSTQAFIATIPRVNKQVQDTAYATRTKNTKIIVASFTMTGSSLPISDGKSSTSGSLSADTVCRVAGAGSYGNCKSVYESTSVLNTTSTMLKGSSDESSSISAGGSSVNGSISAEVPYVVPGTKFCVAVGVSPSDSHNTGNNSAINSDNQSAALSSSGSGYRVGPPACVTVAKKPTFSVESAQLSTNGNVKTSITNANGRVYGSWSEYGIAATGSVSNMGSGAAYGYTSPYFNIATAGFGTNKRTTSAGLPKSTTSTCAYSPQTFGNTDCTLGSAAIIKNSIDSTAVAKKMHELYHMTVSEMKEGYRDEYGIVDIAEARRYFGQSNSRLTISGSSKSWVNFYAGGESACQYSASLGRYIAPAPRGSAYTYVNGRGNKEFATVYCTADGNKYMKVTQDAYYGGSPAIDYGGSGTSDLDHEHGVARPSYRNPVFVIDVEGTLIIDSDIRINNGGHDNFQAIDQIPTILIFAKEVIITDRVTKLDAWIIAGLDGGSGEVNTCGAVGGYGAIIKQEDLTSNKCTKPLEINAPVYAKKIILNRTYGGGGQSGDDESTIKSRFVQRGEIFNLRSDAYYWAYYQSQRNRILTTVYSRELPSRY